ncbi:MAG: hypothetical protein ACYS8X_03390 [Planctomycetota bacterium]
MTEGPRPIVDYLPEGTIRSDEWTDRYALAQELSCRAEFGQAHLTKVDLGDPEPFDVTIEIRIIGTRRHARAAKTKALPTPPEGHRYWRGGPHGPSSFYATGGNFLSVPRSLPGEPHRPGTNPLADDAAALLAEKGLSPVDLLTTVVYRYSIKDDKWQFIKVTKTINLAAAAPFDWGNGLGEDSVKVYAPR